MSLPLSQPSALATVVGEMLAKSLQAVL